MTPQNRNQLEDGFHWRKPISFLIRF